jgi:hypothetical protein
MTEEKLTKDLDTIYEIAQKYRSDKTGGFEGINNCFHDLLENFFLVRNQLHVNELKEY